MFETLDRSWTIMKLSFGVIRKDTEMLLFPLLGGFFSILYGGLLLWPSILTDMMSQQQQGENFVWGAAQTAIAFVTYLGLAFIATFFNTCTVYTAKTRFEGGDATFMDSIRFALSRIHLIFMWSVLAATVGLLLRALDEAADRMGGIGGAILGILHSILGMMWSVMTVFVVPVMVYEEVGPFDAIRRSVEVLKSTWGESLVRHFGLGIIQFLVSIPGILLIAAGVLGSFSLPLLVLGLLWVLVVGLVFSVANTVFNTALYAYANGSAVEDFDSATLSGAFATKARSI